MLEVKKCFISKTPSLKEFSIKFSRRNFGLNFPAGWRIMCLRSAKFFKKQKLQLNIFKWSCALVLINNANVGILEVSWNDSKTLSRWQWKMCFRRCFRILLLEQATNNLKRPAKHVIGFCLYCLLISYTFVNKQTSRIIFSNHSSLTVASGKSWREPCREFKIERKVVWTTNES